MRASPHITHPRRVAESLHHVTHKIVGWLHDVVEDTPMTLDDLREAGFPELIVQAVDSVTRRDGETYLDFILRSKKNVIGAVVKLADLRDNLSDLRPGSLRDKYLMAVHILSA